MAKQEEFCPNSDTVIGEESVKCLSLLQPPHPTPKHYEPTSRAMGARGYNLFPALGATGRTEGLNTVIVLRTNTHIHTHRERSPRLPGSPPAKNKKTQTNSKHMSK